MQSQRGIFAAVDALCRGSVTEKSARRYERVWELFGRWCTALNLPTKCEYAQLSSWAWYYSQEFSQGTLPQHWSAMRWCTEVHGLQPSPLSESVCWRQMRRVMRALQLLDPTEEKQCYPLSTQWLLRMMAQEGLTSTEPLHNGSLSLDKLSFWARTVAAHCAMMRGCEHASGMLGADLVMARTPRVFADTDFWEFFYVLSVGNLTDDLVPRNASNRKLKLRPARKSVLPAWDSLLSAGLWMWALMRKLHGCAVPTNKSILFPAVRKGLPLQRPLSIKAFMKRLKVCATQAGMPAATVKKLEVRSLRAGGCTHAFAKGMPRAAIQQQGGWAGDSVDIYNRPTTSQRWQSFALFWA